MASGRREEILEAAADLLAERGFKGTSIDAVAERAGLTRQGVLYYFPSKKRLLLELMDLRERLAREHVAGRPLGEDCPADFAEAVAFDHSHPWLATVHSEVMAEAATGQEPTAAYVRERYRSLHKDLTAQFVRLFGERLPSGLSAPTAATAALALVEGVHQMWLADQEPDRYPQIVREVLRVLLGSGSGPIGGGATVSRSGSVTEDAAEPGSAAGAD